MAVPGLPVSAFRTARGLTPSFAATSAMERFRARRAVRRLAPSWRMAASTSKGGALIMALSFAMCFKEREVDGFISFKAWHASRALASPACLKGTRLLNLALLKPGFVQHGGTRSGLAQAVRALGPADLKRLRQQLEQENAKLTYFRTSG